MSDLFKELGLTSLAKRLPTVLEQARQGQPSYELFLQQALQAEVDGRKQRAQERRRRAAHLPTTKSVENFDFSFQPTLSQPLVRELANLAFVQTATNIILLGPPGVGKTHLGIAFLVKALEAGYSALFTSLTQLVEGLEATPTQPWQHRLRRYLKPQVLLIDEGGYTP
jgi:DNA replication protein DnaC